MRTFARESLIVLILAGLALGGAGVSGLLLYGTAGGWDREPGGVGAFLRLCDSDQQGAATCSEVQNSPWGTWALGAGAYKVSVPTSFLGFAYFLSLAIWFGMNGRIPADARWLWRGTLILLCWGAIASMALFGVMGLVLRTWCALCVIAHAINAVIVLVTLAWWRMCRRTPVVAIPTGSTTSTPIALRDRLALSAIIVSLMLVVMSWFYYDASIAVRRQWRKLSDLRAAVATLQEDPGFVLREFEAQPVVELALAGGSNANFADGTGAPPTLLIFTDPDHGPCRCFEARRRNVISPALGEGVRTEMRYVSSEWLLGGEADLSEAAKTSHLSVASRAIEAAGLQGGERARHAMHSLLLANPSRRDPESLAGFAQHAGLEGEQLLSDMENEAVRGRVRDGIALARRLGVRAVPAAFLLGRRVPELCLTSETFWREFSVAHSERFVGGVCSPALSQRNEETIRELVAATAE